jgi:ribosomal protein S18 acetylase RimI-like enzyme
VWQPQRDAGQGRGADVAAADGGGIDVRELTPGEVARVDARLPLSRLDWAQTYFVAWDEDDPVGHAHVAWSGAKLGVPEIQDVYIEPDRRRRGVASALSRGIEREAIRRGHRRISLGVGIANNAARRLYERLGFVDAGIAPERVQGTITIRGKPVEIDDTLFYLVKDLPVIRRLERDEVPRVEEALPRSPGVHEERVAAQQRGDGVYLVAWIGQEPVGHAYLSWSGYVEYPEVRDVGVAERRRREGFGTLLMEGAETRARDAKAECVGLAVALDNVGARAFYERLGYTDAGLEPFTISYQQRDDGGIPHKVTERCTYLSKRVDFGRSRSS